MSYLTEAFKQLNIIDEDLFPTDSEGLNKLKDFMKSDIDDEDLVVYDETANNEDEIKDSYNGKVILRCNVCKSYFFKEPKSIIIDAEAGLANVGDECCYCHNDMGYNVVGVVAPYAADVSKEERAEDAHEEPTEVDAVNESTKRSFNFSCDIPENLVKHLNKHTVYIEDVEDKIKSFEIPGVGKLGDNCDNVKIDLGIKLSGLTKEAYDWVDEELYKELEIYADDLDYAVNESVKRIDEETNYDKVMKVLNDMKKEEPIREDLYFTDEAEIRKQLDKYSGQYLTITFKGSEDWKHISELLDEHNNGDDEEEAESALDELESSYRKEYDLLKSLEVDEISEITLYTSYVVVTIKVKKDDLQHNFSDHYSDLINMSSIDKDTIKILELSESVKKIDEDLKDVSITTDDTKIQMTSEENGKVTVITEPVKNEVNIEDAEVVKPLSAADKDVIANNDGEDGEEVLDDTAVDFDEINDEDLDKLGEKYFTKVYDNVKSFKSTACKLDESGVILEGKITFKSGKEAKTAFNFNEAYITKTGKVKLIGENAQFAKNKKAFTLTGSLNDKKLVVESFTYNYRTKDEKTGKSTRLYGTVSK